MMRSIFYFTDTSSFGGAEQAMLTLMAGLDRRRWQPTLVHHPEPGIKPLLERAHKLDVTLWSVPRMPLGRQGAAQVPYFFRALRAKRPAIFHAHLTWPLGCKYGLVSAVLARVPTVIATLHSFLVVPYDYATRVQQRLLAAGVGGYIAVSHEVGRQLGQTFRVPNCKIKVVHNAVSLGDFNGPANSSLRASLARANDGPLILTTARLDRLKGHSYLLQAAAMVPEALFILVGDGPERARLEAQAYELGIDNRVICLGHRQDVPELLASCDLFVLPSLLEGLPLAVLEAMAAGKPVIATQVGGTNEAIINGKSGVLVPPADPMALARAIRKLLSDRPLAERLAAAGQARVHRHFSAESMVRRVTQIYDELLDSSRTHNAYH
jgi:glycosyltransferase involved in cell wall biosynthesis